MWVTPTWVRSLDYPALRMLRPYVPLCAPASVSPVSSPQGPAARPTAAHTGVALEAPLPSPARPPWRPLPPGSAQAPCLWRGSPIGQKSILYAQWCDCQALPVWVSPARVNGT